MITAYCELLLELLEYLIDVNLAIVNIRIRFFIKKEKSKLLQFLCSTTKYSNILGNSKIWIFVKLIYLNTISWGESVWNLSNIQRQEKEIFLDYFP